MKNLTLATYLPIAKIEDVIIIGLLEKDKHTVKNIDLATGILTVTTGRSKKLREFNPNFTDTQIIIVKN